MQRILFSSLLLSAFMSSAYLRAAACSYIGSPHPPIEYIVSRTTTIFVGKLVKKANRVLRDDGDTYRITELTFEVTESIKGKKDPRQSIYFTERLTNRNSCVVDPPPSEVGEDWVVFIGYDEGSEVQRFVQYSEYLSRRFDRLEEHDRDRLALIKNAAAERRQSFFGTLQQPMLGTFSKLGLARRVELRSENGSELIRTQMPIDNRIRFDDLTEGTYTVRIFTDKKAQFFAPEEKVSSTHKEDGQEFFADFKIVMDAGLVQYENFVLGDSENYQPRSH